MMEEARMILLYVVIHELLIEELEAAKDQDRKPSYAAYDTAAFAELVANPDRSMITHLMGYTEGEMVYACRNIWNSFT